MSPPDVRDEMADYWLEHARWWDFRGRCEMKNVQVIEEILKRPEVFGERWKAPKATLLALADGGK